ncbi:MAG TPA: hypothetical protein VFR31_18925 [Thermoanaerobaculia bacterium]|nr:hypothetical protein [Thermoanaerobaculia bacterium]
MTSRRVVLVDACVLINLAFTDRLGLLGSLPPFEFLAPGETLGEVVRLLPGSAS